MKRLFLAFLFPLLLLSSCEKEHPQIQREAEITFEVKAPINMEGEITKIEGRILSKSKGTETALTFKDNKATQKLTQGEEYTLDLSATYATTGVEAIISYSEDLKVKEEERYSKDCQLMFEIPKSSFVISEIFFAGSRDRKGIQYDEDKYIVITNNSPVTRYADGLALIRSLWTSTEKKEQITPNLMDTHFVTDLVMQIPGRGKEHPVKPYEHIILCHSAINHKKDNPNSIDLSNANFEWMSDKGYTDAATPDNPTVPNMINLYMSDPYGEGTQNWVMDNNGQHTYAIADLKGNNAETLSRQYKYDYTEIMAVEGLPPMEVPGNPALKLPIDWIIDAVNLSMPNEYQWLPIAKILDAGYAFVAETHNDGARYGKKVIRKPIKEGEKQLKDTNNSSDDFISQEIYK